MKETSLLYCKSRNHGQDNLVLDNHETTALFAFRASSVELSNFRCVLLRKQAALR